MPPPRIIVRVRPTMVVRESDGRTMLLIEGWCGSDERPIFLQVVDPSDDEE